MKHPTRQMYDKHIARKKALAKRRDDRRHVKFRITPEEHDKLKAICKRKKMTINKFCGVVLRAAVAHLNERDRQ